MCVTFVKKGNPMRIIIINGSPRLNGFTAAILHGMEEALRGKNADVEYYDLSGLSISQCQGCCGCYTTGHCHINDDAEMLSERIAKADGVILGSPTYASNVSGYMKTFIDRGHFVIEQLLKDKYCVSVATGENYGNKDAAKVLNKLIQYSGGRLVKSLAVKATFNGFDKNDAAFLGKKTADHLYSVISGAKKYPGQAIYHAIIFSLGIKPFVLKKGNQYKGVTDKWKEVGIL